MKMYTVYETTDGKTFSDERSAKEHEDRINKSHNSRYERFFKTYSGADLLKKHSLTEHGVWEVRGEDPNCDLGGHHHQPYIGTFTGTLDSVIRHAVTYDSWETWGGGGSIKKVKIKEV